MNDPVALPVALPPSVLPNENYEGRTLKAWNAETNDISRSEFVRCRISDCRNSGLVAKGTLFEDCHFTDCDFSNAMITGAKFIDCVFTGCKLLGWKWSQANTPLFVRLTNCNCAESSFFGLQLKKAQFTNCVFTNADFGEATLSHANLSGSDFTGARFLNTDLSHADLRSAHDYTINVRANIIKKAKFSLPEAVSLLHSLDIVLD